MTFLPVHISIKSSFTAKTIFYENVKSKASVLCFENGQNLQRSRDNFPLKS